MKDPFQRKKLKNGWFCKKAPKNQPYTRILLNFNNFLSNNPKEPPKKKKENTLNQKKYKE